MRLCYSSIPVLTCCICLGLYHSPANPAIPHRNPKILQLAQASSTSVPNPSIQNIQVLQTQLKKLGFYDGVVDGQYSKSTQIAIAEFQKAKGLVADGIAGKQTKESLQAATIAKTPLIPSASPASKPTSQAKASDRGFIWWSLLGLGLLGSIGVILYLMRRFGRVKQVQQPQTSDAETETATNKDSEMSSSKLDTTPNPVENIPTASISTKLLPAGQTSRLAKLNIVDELIKDLHSHDPNRRRKAIWDLGQQGDSRAIQPLLDLMMDVDSQQRSLILAAVGEIGTRTLKPMNRALAISMQDESPQVRQNAIRDLTRVYDMMSQISQILCHALEDPDAEVQATAKYALNQMNRIRTVPEQRNLAEE